MESFLFPSRLLCWKAFCVPPPPLRPVTFLFESSTCRHWKHKLSLLELWAGVFCPRRLCDNHKSSEMKETTRFNRQWKHEEEKCENAVSNTKHYSLEHGFSLTVTSPRSVITAWSFSSPARKSSCDENEHTGQEEIPQKTKDTYLWLYSHISNNKPLANLKLPQGLLLNL